MRALVLLLALVVTYAGCGPSSRRWVRPAAAEGVVWVQADHLTQEQRARLLRAWEHHRASWAADWGRPAPGVRRLELWGAPVLPQGTLGWADWNSGVVQLVAGPQLNLPLAYHELVHLEVHDSGHADPRWGTEWASAQVASVASFLRVEGLP